MRSSATSVTRSMAAWLGLAVGLFSPASHAQLTTTGFANSPRPEAPGTLLSHPVTNGSEPIGRTTSLNYLNGWLIVGAEAPGSREGSDLVLRVYDISNPADPVRRLPSDFGLTYPNNRWYQGNYGWGAHGTARVGDMLVPDPLRVPSFGGPVQRGGTEGGHGLPSLAQLPLGYTRSSQAGPWDAAHPWYGSPDDTFYLRQPYLQPNGYVAFRPLAAFDHVGPFGGGDWHPMIFGDLLIYVRSGGSGRDGVVVYRMQFNNFDDPATRSITPVFVASLNEGFSAYWPTLFSDGSGLHVIGSSTDVLMAADITAATTPGGDDDISLVASLTVPGFSNASYPTFQDQFGFIHNRKVDMTRLLAGDPDPITLTLNEYAPPVPAGVPAPPVGVNTSQMSLPLGNLWLTGGYPIPGTSQGLGVWVHQQAPDTTRPRVTYHIPQANRAGYPRHAPLSFLLHEHGRAGGPRNGIDFLVRPVQPDGDLGSAVSGFLIHDFSGVLTFTPDAGLAADTTYQVDFVADDNGTPANLADDTGFHDAAGNLIEPYSFRFSTGAALDATPPPAFTELTASAYQPAPGEPVTITASASGGGPLEYRFNFAGSWSAWSASPSAQHSYAAPAAPACSPRCATPPARSSPVRSICSSTRVCLSALAPPRAPPSPSATIPPAAVSGWSIPTPTPSPCSTPAPAKNSPNTAPAPAPIRAPSPATPSAATG